MISSMLMAAALVACLVYGCLGLFGFGWTLVLSPLIFILWYALADLIASYRGY